MKPASDALTDRWRRVGRAAMICLVAAAALVAVACGGNAGEPGGAAGDTATVRTAGSKTAEASATDSARIDWTEADTVNVRLTEYRIQMPRTLPPGPKVFHVTNAGAVEHNFEIEGEGPTGINEAFGRNLHPTQTRDLRVLLEPGKFKIFCSVDAHARRGGILILEVPAAGSPTDGSSGAVSRPGRTEGAPRGG